MNILLNHGYKVFKSGRVGWDSGHESSKDLTRSKYYIYIYHLFVTGSHEI